MDEKMMTKGERDDLARLIKQRARVDRAKIETRRAELYAEFEATMAKTWEAEDERFRDLTREANDTVRRVNREISERCVQLGIPAEFAPAVGISWMSRGTNSLGSRRAELRRVAQTRLEAMARRAKNSVDESEVATLGRLVAHGLSTAASVEFLASMPDVGALMRPLDAAELEAEVPIRRRIES